MVTGWGVSVCTCVGLTVCIAVFVSHSVLNVQDVSSAESAAAHVCARGVS